MREEKKMEKDCHYETSLQVMYGCEKIELWQIGILSYENENENERGKKKKKSSEIWIKLDYGNEKL